MHNDLFFEIRDLRIFCCIVIQFYSMREELLFSH